MGQLMHVTEESYTRGSGQESSGGEHDKLLCFLKPLHKRIRHFGCAGRACPSVSLADR